MWIHLCTECDWMCSYKSKTINRESRTNTITVGVWIQIQLWVLCRCGVIALTAAAEQEGIFKWNTGKCAKAPHATLHTTTWNFKASSQKWSQSGEMSLKKFYTPRHNQYGMFDWIWLFTCRYDSSYVVYKKGYKKSNWECYDTESMEKMSNLP